MSKFNQVKYIQAYNKEHYHKLTINLLKDDFELFKKYTADRGESLRGFICRAAKNQIKADTANTVPASSETVDANSELEVLQPEAEE